MKTHFLLKYQPSGEGALALRLQRRNAAPPAKSKMADGVWKGVYPQIFGHSKQLLLNKFFDPSTPSMRKVDDREKKRKDCGFSGHYVIASSRPPKHRPLERRTLVPSVEVVLT